MTRRSARPRTVLRLAPLLALPLALLVYLTWPRSAAQGGCIESELEVPANEASITFACGRATLTTPSKTVELPVEIAETPEQTERGLMFRPSLGEEAGMAFLFDQPSRGGFWMKNTLVLLSIAFFDQRGRINDILDMPPCVADPCDSYTPKHDYVGALEVSRGFFDRHGIRVGASFSLAR